MDGTEDYLTGLAQIHTRPSIEDRRALWRLGLASLAAAAADQQPTPLEGVATESLLASVRVALTGGLVDDLSFLSRPVATAALFELAGALPPGPEKRELGRRVLSALHEGDAATFVTLAAALALASPRALGDSTMRARVGLALRLPIAAGTAADSLALAMISRPELERDWLTSYSTGALPSRCLAARLLERSAREAARRAKEGDDSTIRVFDRPAVRTAWMRLITDRESLVWRHVAAARGALALAAPAWAAEIERDLAPRLGPTEWRRAATSLAASVAHTPDRGVARCLSLLGSDIVRRDRGVAASAIYGLSQAMEEEPEAAEELLNKLVLVGGLDAMEALIDLREDHAGSPTIGAQAAFIALDQLRGATPGGDDGAFALVEALRDDLEMTGERTPSVRAHLSAALGAFTDGRDLTPDTDRALEAAQRAISVLEDRAPDRRAVFRALRELDAGLLQTSTLGDLLVVRSHDDPFREGPLSNMLWVLGSWLLGREQTPLHEACVPHLTLRLSQMRTLLHLVDAETGTTEDPSPATRGRRMKTFRMLSDRVREDVVSPLRRVTCAALARASDALVREQVHELSDVFVTLCWCVKSAEDLRSLAEACMVPEFKDVFAAAAGVARTLSDRTGQHEENSIIEALRLVADALPPGSSARIEGLRRAVLGITRALEPIADACGLGDLRGNNDGTVLDRLASAITYAARLVAGAGRRTGLREGFFPVASTRALRKLEAWVDRALEEHDEGVGPAVAAAAEAIRQDLPPLLAEVVNRVLLRLGQLPPDTSQSGEFALPVKRTRQQHLPGWLPPSRVLGGFYIVRPIGSGSGGSVFVARRTEERHDEHAESFALKVPAYNGSAAHTLSEDEFLQLFRSEAGALLTLPAHRNLAGFVTFDVGARPKPILVMELVQGPTLERLLDKRILTVPAALDVLDGMAAGLEAMHGVGIGHLDVKPANVILRSTEGTGLHALGGNPSPALVDFGLAGRKVRPGCGSPYYGAPEVWDRAAFGEVDPRATDVYAFCCLAYEMLTGETLFAGDTLSAVITAHLSRPNGPAGLDWMRRARHLAQLAELLSRGLAHNPTRRPALADVRAHLAEIGRALRTLPWPLRPT
jgi:hypothetical protein